MELVPTYRSLVVHYDPLVVGFEELAAELRVLVGRVPASTAAVGADDEPPIEIPIVYGGEAGPDLPDVARHAGLSGEEVVRRHAAGEYRVAMLGFAPGFPYLMGLDPSIACPRRATPRVRVPAGSVAIAETQTGIYPFAMPGGWRLIGRTGLPLFDPRRDPPATLRPGARVRFVPATAADALTSSVHVRTRAAPRPHAARAVRVIEPGVLATVQDAGRFGYQRYGVPPSGAADGLSLALGNLAVGNEAGAAAIEVTAGGAEFGFSAPTRLAVTGAEADLTLAGRPVRQWEPVVASPGDRLRIGLARNGLRIYLCLGGGLAVDPVLGSRSTYLAAAFGGVQGRALRAGDLLPLGSGTSREGAPAVPMPPDLVSLPAGTRIEVPFLPGAEWDDLAEAARRRFLDRTWRVSHQSDRIGLRLEGEPIEAGTVGRGLVSDGTVTGTVQLSGDGLPIILLVDRQTIGGYPRLGAVAQVGHHRLGQAGAGDEIVFRPVTMAEAQRALRALDESLRRYGRSISGVMRVQGAVVHP